MDKIRVPMALTLRSLKVHTSDGESRQFKVDELQSALSFAGESNLTELVLNLQDDTGRYVSISLHGDPPGSEAPYLWYLTGDPMLISGIVCLPPR